MSHKKAFSRYTKKILEHRLFAALVIAGANFLLFGWIVSSGFLYSWNFRLTDALYTTENKTSSDIVIVAIDDKSLERKEDGGLGRWQEWGRDYHATVIQNLLDAGAAVVGVDILFLEPSADQAADQELAKVVTGSDKVILASTFDSDRQLYVKPLGSFYGEDESKIGSIKQPVDVDNIVRHAFLYLPFENKFYESFDIKIVKNFLGEPAADTLSELPIEGDQYVVTKNKIRLPFDLARVIPPIKVPITENNLMYINFFGSPFSYRQISYADIYHQNFKPEEVKDKIILIGEMGATGLHDVQYTPVSRGVEMPGVEIHANNIQTLLTGKFLRTQDLRKQIVSIGIVNVFTTILFLMVPVLFSTLILVLGTFVFVVMAVIAFNTGLLVSMFYIPLSYITVYIFAILYKYLVEARGRKYLKSAFSHYVSEQLVEKIIKDPDLLQLGGAKRELTIMFSDLQGFTSLSEKLLPEALISMLNQYLSDMTSIVFHHRGTLDKYIGDAIMAFWGAPLEDKEHAYHACLTALEMQHRMKEIHVRFKQELDIELYVRIGINTGEAIVGNVGSNVRFDYTVIGDSVNLSSRLEGANKQYHTFIMVSENTYNPVKDRFEFRELDYIKVKGKTKPVRIFELVDKKGHVDVQKQSVINHFHKGLHLYRDQHWEKAMAAFKEALAIDPTDGPSQVYMERCEYYKKEPPPEDWDGSFEMKTK